MVGPLFIAASTAVHSVGQRMPPRRVRVSHFIPIYVLPTFSNVARGLGIDDRKGRLAPGKDADLVFLTENLMVDKAGAWSYDLPAETFAGRWQ
jgi:hypothetical protein